MLIVLIVIAIIVIIPCLIFLAKTYYDDNTVINVFLILVFIICFSIIIFGSAIALNYMTNIATENVIDNRIEMYQEENAKIEKEIDDIVNAYMLFENDTFKELKIESSTMTLATFYPELKSNELIQRQIEIHTANNSKIKELKEQKINIEKEKWLLYFGK